MHTLKATRDVRKVSLWLGHASLQSTEFYLRADPTEKLEALAAMAPPSLKPGRFAAADKLLAMLKSIGRSDDRQIMSSNPTLKHRRRQAIAAADST